MIDEDTNMEVAKCCLSCKFSYNRQPYEDNAMIYCKLDINSGGYCHIYDICDKYEEGTDIENKWED